MASDKITIEVNGVELEARPGQMLIEVTDAADVYVPRFCYHEKLSVAANCRMCLVEVEKAPKPLPACATPVAPGMKVFTRSPKAIAAQKAVMEFLLINHPLDCPICDQGGECELQDLAMGYGRDISRYTEGKRVVRDKDLGPLVSTDMTRCIHCTRCVRFGQEIAGIQELGTIGRGDRTEISTYIERSVDHELSGNIIDLCPVGALNNKPYRFSARAWEMVARPGISPHDCLGSHLQLHVLEGRVMRVVPEPCEAINETWLSDRDRFSYAGIYAPDRVREPMIRRDDELVACSWDEALEFVAAALKQSGADTAALLSPGSTVEEGYLVQRLVRHLGAHSVDHRLRRRDFRDQDADPLAPGLGMSIAAVERLQGLLIVGAHLRKEVPLLAHRVRKAALAGGRVSLVNAEPQELLFGVAAQHTGADLVSELGALLKAAVDEPPAAVASLLASAAPVTDAHRVTVESLRAERAAIFLGQIAGRHPRFAELRALAAALASATGATLGVVPEGANAAGLALAGALPHREPGGRPVAAPGKHVAELLAASPEALVLFGLEPEHDLADPAGADRLLGAAGTTIAITPFLTGSLARHADVVLPIGTFAETSGTFVNAAGTWQTFAGAASPVGSSRPGWKVLRVLGNLIGLDGCDYETSAEVLADLQAVVNRSPAAAPAAPGKDLGSPPSVAGPAILDVPMYRVDALVRRSGPLQQTRDGLAGSVPRGTDREVA